MAEAASSSDAPSSPVKLHSTPWREPKHELPSGEIVSNLSQLVSSPRFQEAARRYGITEPEKLVPRDPSEFKGGSVDAALFARQEKRRLVDLGGVLMERQRILDAERAEAKTPTRKKRRPKSASAILPEAAGPSPPSGADANEGIDDPEFKLKQDAVIAKQLRTIDNEKKRTKMEMISLVESETEKQVRRDMEIEYQRQLAAHRKAAMIEQDRERRQRIKDSREELQARQDRLYGNLAKTIENRRQKQAQQTRDFEERMALRHEITRQELRRREVDGAKHAQAIRDRGQAARDAAAAVVLEKHHQMEMEAKRRAEKRAAERWTPEGKVTAVLEGPLGSKIAAVKQRELEQREARNRAMAEKMEEERLRAEAHAQMRASGLELRREATRQRMQAFHASKERAKVTEEIFKQDTLARIDQGTRNVHAVHSNMERLIKEQRQLSLARDHEKAMMVERVQRARDHHLGELRKKQKAVDDRITSLFEKRAKVKAESRQKVDKIHYARQHLKEEISLSTTDSMRTMRYNSSLLSKLGVEMSELETAASTLKQSISAPVLRPVTAPHAITPASRRASRHVKRSED